MVKTNLIQKMLWLCSIILAVVLVDQLVKQWMIDWIGPGQRLSRVEMLGSFFAFEYLENRGAAFGLFQQGTTVLAIISVVVTAIGFFVMMRVAKDEFILAAAIALILGGAIGNATDRFSRGYVVDFIAIGRFWKFNLADSAVTVGVILTLFLLWQSERSTSQLQYEQEE